VALLEKRGFLYNHSGDFPQVILIVPSHVPNTIVIFCDLKKAFDTCDHKILLKKLHNIGVRGTELRWFENYLSNRNQFVFVNNVSSSMLKILRESRKVLFLALYSFLYT
jgi:hypothetical protein